MFLLQLQFIFILCRSFHTKLFFQNTITCISVVHTYNLTFFTKYNGKIYISARSIDELNEQVMMERLGGGGHINMAGAQLKDMSMEEAKAIIRETIDNMITKGEA